MDGGVQVSRSCCQDHPIVFPLVTLCSMEEPMNTISLRFVDFLLIASMAFGNRTFIMDIRVELIYSREKANGDPG